MIKISMLLAAMLCLPAPYIFTQNIGIGTNAPTAQLHTTGTVRHATFAGTGIRPLFADPNGNLLVNLPPLPPSTVTNNTPQNIPDINCTGVTSNNTLSSLPASVSSTSIMVTVNITHPRLADLSIYLVAPGGAVINLVSPAAGLTGANFSNTVFTDAGTTLAPGGAPYSGKYKPYTDMTPSICGITPTVASFAAIGGGNINPNGSWSLKVIDNTASNTGSLTSWSVSVVSGLGIDGVWSLKGNSGTNAFNFIGTIDKQPLRIRVNNNISGLIDTLANTFLGYQGGSKLAGIKNTGIGWQALFSNTVGSNNTAVGNAALHNNINGYNLVGIGDSSLYHNTSGTMNTATGSKSLFANTSGSHNTSNGILTLASNTSGNYNTATGTFTLSANTTGSGNTATGSYSMLNNTTGSSNTAAGSDALHNNTTGWVNTAIGTGSLYSNISGSANIAIGSDALTSNQDGNGNTAAGLNALFQNQSGNDNVAVGIGALRNNTGTSNLVAVGDSALFSNGTGVVSPGESIYNTGIGSKALSSNTIGSYNSALGFNALRYNESGNANTAGGFRSLYQNVSGMQNTGFGVSSLFTNISGSQNTANGAFSLFNNSSGSTNTASGYYALYQNNNGSSNTAVGSNALFKVESGSSNTAIGAGADVFNGGFNNATAIGAGAIAIASNTIKLGNNNVTDIYANNNSNLWVGDIYSKGNGMVRNSSSLQLKISVSSYVVSSNINALTTIQIPFSFSEIFSTAPVVFVGNITGGPGGFAELIMSVANVTTTGGTLFVSNPRTSSMAPNFTVKIVAIGGQ